MTTSKQEEATLIIPNTFYALEINPRSIKEMIEQGHYDCINSDITSKRFGKKPNSKKVENVLIELVHFSESILDNEVDKKLSEAGLESVGIRELLTFGATYSKEQLDYLILARGSQWNSMIPGLDYIKGIGTPKRSILNLYSTSGKGYPVEWPTDVFFIVKVKEVESSLKK